MNPISNATLRRLIEQPAGTYVSIYLPIEAGAPGAQRNQTTAKNLLKRAEERLVNLGAREAEAAAFLEPARRDTRENGFWAGRGRGLAAFIGAGHPVYVDLPYAPAEQLLAGPRFAIRPLLPALENAPRGHALAISRHDVRLFHVSGDDIEALSLNDTPRSLEEALREDTLKPVRGLHTVPASVGTGAPMGISHAQVIDEKDRARRFLSQVDDGVTAALKDDRGPLLLLGVDALIAIYREVSAHPRILAECVHGNFDRTTPAEIHAAAVDALRIEASRGAQEAITRFQNAVQTPRASAQLDDILRAAAQGRVESLLLDAARFAWGSYDPITGDTRSRVGDSSEPAQADDDELMDLAASQTLLHRGAAFNLPSKQMPFGLAIAAVFRY